MTKHCQALKSTKQHRKSTIKEIHMTGVLYFKFSEAKSSLYIRNRLKFDSLCTGNLHQICPVTISHMQERKVLGPRFFHIYHIFCFFGCTIPLRNRMFFPAHFKHGKVAFLSVYQLNWEPVAHKMTGNLSLYLFLNKYRLSFNRVPVCLHISRRERAEKHLNHFIRLVRRVNSTE